MWMKECECVWMCMCKNWFPWETLQPSNSQASNNFDTKYYWQFLKDNRKKSERQNYDWCIEPLLPCSCVSVCECLCCCHVYLYIVFLFNFNLVVVVVVLMATFSLLLSLFISFWHLCSKQQFNGEKRRRRRRRITSSSSRPWDTPYMFNWLNF